MIDKPLNNWNFTMTNEINASESNASLEKEENIQQTETTVNVDKETQEMETKQLPESTNMMQVVDALLKTPESIVNQIKAGQFKQTVFILLLIFILCHAVYGLIVGSFSGNAQWFAAPLKILGGAILSALLCYPSFYIFACLSGANATPSQILALLVGGLALTSILLLGFAPVAFIFTFSIKTLGFMGLIHLLIWSISIYFGLRYIMTGLLHLEGHKDNGFIKVWSIILILTLLQMTTTLRPILGESDTFLTQEKRFFIEHWIKELDNKKTNSDQNNTLPYRR